MYHRYCIGIRRIIDILLGLDVSLIFYCFPIHVYTCTCIYMYIHVYTCIYMHIHVGSHFCTLETRFTILQLQTDTNEVRKKRTEVLGPPPEPEFCALFFWNDRGLPLAPSDSVLFEN